MSCYRPISISNNTIDFNSAIHPVYQSFPCGKCEACLQEKRNDLYVRMYYEYEKLKRNKKGAMYFLTFTFSPDMVPMINTDDYKEVFKDYPDYPSVSCMSFDKGNFSKFLKKLRVFAKKYLETDITVLSFSEYGGSSEHSHRPHYHTIITTYDNVSDFDLKRICDMAWSVRVNKKDLPDGWEKIAKLYFSNQADNYDSFFTPHGKGDIGLYLAHRAPSGYISYQKRLGYVSASDNGMRVQSIELMEYLTKYLSKDSNYMALPAVNSIVKFLSTLPKIEEITDKKQLDAIHDLKRVLPFTVIPHHFGDLLADDLDCMYYDPAKHEQAVHILAENSVSTVNKAYNYRIPSYIVNKLFYNIRDVDRLDVITAPDGSEFIEVINTKKRVFTEIAKHILTLRAQRRKKSLEVKYRQYLHPNFLAAFRNLSTLTDKDKTQYEVLLNLLPESIDYPLLATYKLHFQNISQEQYRQWDFSHTTSQQWQRAAEEFIAYRIDFNNCITSNTAAPCKSAIQRNWLLNQMGTLNDLPIFQEFDLILKLVDFMSDHISRCDGQKHISDQIIMNMVRKLYNEYKYSY